MEADARERSHPLTLEILTGRFAVCRLPAGSEVPGWALRGPMASVTLTADELSIVCREENVPATTAEAPELRREAGWRCLRVEGPLAFSQTGVLASLVAPLAEVGISVFAVSTFDTDYLLLADRDLATAVTVLYSAGHEVKR